MNAIELECQKAHLAVGTHSPGDGVTRYRFFHANTFGEVNADYFQGKGIHTALGKKAALSFLEAYKMGLHDGSDMTVLNHWKDWDNHCNCGTLNE